MNKNLLKHILIPGIGFGIGGMVWGISIYQSILMGEDFPIFSYSLGAVALGFFGSISLILISHFINIKKVLKISLFGIVISFIGFILGLVIIYPFSFYVSGIIRTLFCVLGSSQMTWEAISMLEPSLAIGDFFLSFAFIGFIVGASYAFALKIKVLSLAKYGAIGFALGSLIGPVIGNGILNLSGSLLLTYLTTFFIICAFLGAFLGLGIYKNIKKSN